MDFEYNDVAKTMTISYDSENTVQYSAVDSEGAVAGNMENLTFVDSTGTKWAFSDEADLSALKTNNIVMTNGATIKDSAKNDIIQGLGTSGETPTGQGFHYTAGKDKYYGSEYADNYTLDEVGLTKNTQLVVSEQEGVTDDNVFNLVSDMNDATLFFNVDKTGKVVGNTDLVILDRATYLNGTAASALLSDFAKGSVTFENFFGANQTTFSNDNNYGDGYIKTVTEGLDEDAVNMKALVEQTAETVAAWLSDHQNYADAIDVLETGNKTDIQSLMNAYNTANYVPENQA